MNELYWVMGLILFLAGLATGCQYKRDVVARLKADNERLRRLAHDYITAYEKLAFGGNDER